MPSSHSHASMLPPTHSSSTLLHLYLCFCILIQDVLVEIRQLLNLWVLLPSDFLKPQLLNQHTGCFLMVLPVEDGKTPTKKVKVKTSHFLCHHLSLFGWDFANHQAEPVKNPPCTLQRLVQIKKSTFDWKENETFSANYNLECFRFLPNYCSSSQLLNKFQIFNPPLYLFCQDQNISK